MEAVAQNLMTTDEKLAQLKLHLRRVQDHMTMFVVSHRKPSLEKVRDWVYLKIQTPQAGFYAFKSKVHPKLSASYYYGPFLVTTKIVAVAFHLQLSVEARIHLAFHVSQLKLGIGDKPIEAELHTELQG